MFSITTVSDTIVSVLLCTFVTLLVYAIRYAHHVHTTWTRFGVPNVRGWPIIGNMLPVMLFRRSIAEHFDDIYRDPATNSSAVVGLHFFMQPALMLRDPQLIRRLAVADAATFCNRYSGPDARSDLLGGCSLLFVKNRAWRTIRARTTPFFTVSRMRAMFGLMARIGTDLGDALDDGSAAASVVQMTELWGQYSTDIVASCAFGVQANSLRDACSEFRRHGRAIFEVTARRAVVFASIFFLPAAVPVFGMKLFTEKSGQFLRETIGYVMDERERTKEVRNDLIDMLVVLREEDRGKVFSTTDIVFQGDVLVAQAATFFTAGSETTSNTLAFAMFELCHRPDVQSRIRHEIEQLLKQCSGREPTYDELMALDYLGMVIAETLRLYPTLPFLDRECILPDRRSTHSLKPFSDFGVPHGMPIVIPVYSLHRDARYFPRPDHFDPERFSAAGRAHIVPYTYLPFGVGPHDCVGKRFALLQMRVGLFNFFRRNRAAPAADGRRTTTTVSLDRKSLLLKAEGGVYVSVIRDPVMV